MNLPGVIRRATLPSIPADLLLVANQDSDTIVTFRIDPLTGELQSTGQVTHVPTPVCIKMIIPDGK